MQKFEPIINLVTNLRARGVRFGLIDGRVSWEAPAGTLTVDTTELLVSNEPIVKAILGPDQTLPGEIVIPSNCANSIAAITRCVDAQRTSV